MKTKPSKLLSYLFSEASSVTSETNHDSLQAEISSYLSKPCLNEEDDDPLQFWKEHLTSYPTLAKLAACYLAIPACWALLKDSSVLEGKFLGERCRLTDKNFKKLMNIKCNAHLLSL